MASRSGNGDGDVADLTIRLLRELRAQMATKDDIARVEAKMVTKEELAKVEARLDARIDKVEARLGERIDVLARIFKDNHRVMTGRVRAVEIRVGARRPR